MFHINNTEDININHDINNYSLNNNIMNSTIFDTNIINNCHKEQLNVLYDYLLLCNIKGFNDTSYHSIKLIKTIPNFLEKINELVPRIAKYFNNSDINLSRKNFIINTHEYAIDILKSMCFLCFIMYNVTHKNDGNYFSLVPRQKVLNMYDHLDSTFTKRKSQIHYEILINTPKYNFEYYDELIEQYKEDIILDYKCENSATDSDKYDIQNIVINNQYDESIYVYLRINGQSIFKEVIKPRTIKDILKDHLVRDEVLHKTFATFELETINDNVIIKPLVTYKKRKCQLDKTMYVPIKINDTEYNVLIHCDNMTALFYSN